MSSLCISLPSIAATDQLAQKIAIGLQQGDLLALEGPLGAGKTTFARALLRVLGITDDVPSPTFTLLQTYYASLFPIYHFDLYRLKSETELDELGWDDACAGGLAIIEWPERGSSRMPEDRLVLKFAVALDKRTCLLEPHGTWNERVKEIL